MSKKYKSKQKRNRATSSDWERLTEDALLRSAYLQFATAVKNAQESANVRAVQVGLPAQSVIDLREAGRILDQHPQLVRYLESVRERQDAYQSAMSLPLDMTKASPTGTTPQSANLGGWAGYSDRNQPQGVPNAKMLRDWADANEWVNAAITYYAERIGRADVAILPMDEHKPYNRAAEKQIQLLFDQPNELGDTWPSLMRMGVRDYLTLGRLMLSKNMTTKRIPTALYAEDASLIRVYPAWNGNPDEARFLYTDDNGRTKIPLRNDEVIAIFDNLSTFRFSFSRVQVLRNTIIADLKASESAARLVDQKPPPHIVQIPGASNEQISKLRSVYEEQLAGRREVLFLGGPNPAQVKPMIFSLRDNQWMEWMEYLVRKIAIVFGLSLTHFSFTESINKATSTTQKDLSEDRGLITAMLLIEEHMNRQCVADFAPRMSNGRTDMDKLNLRFLFPEISEASRMMHAAEVVEQATKSLAGLPSQTLNQVLLAQGLSPVRGGDTFYTNSANGPIPWLSYDGDLGSYVFPNNNADPVGTQDPEGGPTTDETADDDIGNNNPANDSNSSTPDTTNVDTVSPDSTIDPSANTSEKYFKDYRKPGRLWSPSLLTRQQSRPEPSRLPEDVQARKQLEQTVKRIFADVEKRAKKQLGGVGE